MKPQTFMKAAKNIQLIDLRDESLHAYLYACDALSASGARCLHFPLRDYKLFFSEMFRENSMGEHDPWFSSFRYDTRSQLPPISKETQLQRTLALLFCYEMSKENQNEQRN